MAIVTNPKKLSLSYNNWFNERMERLNGLEHFDPNPRVSDGGIVGAAGKDAERPTFAQAVSQITKAGEPMSVKSSLRIARLFEQLENGTEIVACTQDEMLGLVQDETGKVLKPELMEELGASGLDWAFLSNPNTRDLVFLGFGDGVKEDPDKAMGTVYIKRQLGGPAAFPMGEMVSSAGDGWKISDSPFEVQRQEQIEIIPTTISITGVADGRIKSATFAADDGEVLDVCASLNWVDWDVEEARSIPASIKGGLDLVKPPFLITLAMTKAADAVSWSNEIRLMIAKVRWSTYQRSKCIQLNLRRGLFGVFAAEDEVGIGLKKWNGNEIVVGEDKIVSVPLVLPESKKPSWSTRREKQGN